MVDHSLKQSSKPIMVLAGTRQKISYKTYNKDFFYYNNYSNGTVMRTSFKMSLSAVKQWTSSPVNYTEVQYIFL